MWVFVHLKGGKRFDCEIESEKDIVFGKDAAEIYGKGKGAIFPKESIEYIEWKGEEDETNRR